MARFWAIGRVLGWSEETLTGVGRARVDFGRLATGRQTSLFGAELFGAEFLGRCSSERSASVGSVCGSPQTGFRVWCESRSSTTHLGRS
jgi:hypothetical protein